MTAKRTRVDTCRGPECDRVTETADGELCHAHAERVRNGRPLLPLRPTTPEGRFWAKVAPPDANGCLIWQGATRGAGRYGAFSGQGAHRVAYQWAHPDVSLDGLELDHLCRVTLCVNPEHLEPVCHRENILRGESLAAQNAAKTHCLRGHELTPENVRRTTYGGRQCLACDRRPERLEAQRRTAAARRARIRAEAVAR